MSFTSCQKYSDNFVDFSSIERYIFPILASLLVYEPADKKVEYDTYFYLERISTLKLSGIIIILKIKMYSLEITTQTYLTYIFITIVR